VNDQLESQRSTLLHALENSFSIGYLTLVSIIEAGAFGFLATLIDRLTSRGTKLDSITLPSWLLVAEAFFIIVAIWNEYFMGVTVFNWIPTLVDAIIPFTLATVQLFLTLSIERGIRWGFLTTAVFYFVGFFAFENMWLRAGSDQRNMFVMDIVRPYRILSSCSCLAVSVIFFLIGIFAPYLPHGRIAQTSGAAILLLTTILQLIRGWCYWFRIVHAARNEPNLIESTEPTLSNKSKLHKSKPRHTGSSPSHGRRGY